MLAGDGFVYYDVPKTGSCSIEQVLSDRCGNVMTILPIDFGRKHARSESRQPIRIASIRHPADRAISLFFYMRHLLPNRFWSNLFKPQTASLSEFLNDCIRRSDADPATTEKRYYLFFPMARYLSGLSITHFLRLENLQSDLAALPFMRSPVSVPHINKGEFREKIDLSKSERRLLYEWCREDFEVFNYAPVH